MKWRCRREGHDWFPDWSTSEYLPRVDMCIRCRDTRVLLPWGECLGGHPIADHYEPSGEPAAPVPECRTGGPC